MKLSFLIDDNYLIAHTLASMNPRGFSSQEYKNDIVAFQNFAWKKSETCYNFLVARFYPELWLGCKADELLQFLPQYLDFLVQSASFKPILKQTEDYLRACEKQWNLNLKVTLTILRELTGLSFDETFTVFITHPTLRNGCYLGDNKIAWGHHEDWPNYTTIYLWHEILHSHFADTELDHALISLLTDEELRSRLNHDVYPPFVTHKKLFPLMKKLLPSWRKYLVSKNKDIFKFKKEVLCMSKNF